LSVAKSVASDRIASAARGARVVRQASGVGNHDAPAVDTQQFPFGKFAQDARKVLGRQAKL
jgi:hypothetical protein